MILLALLLILAVQAIRLRRSLRLAFAGWL